MSGESQPITPARFAAALPDLPLSSLYAKRAEVENSIAHLEISNQELQNYADEGDIVCKEAIRENLEVLERMRSRIDLLRAEIEDRGYKWEEQAKLANGDSREEESAGQAIHMQAADNQETQALSTSGDNGELQPLPTTIATSRQGGSLNDEELARRLAEQMDDGEGIHL